MQLQEKFRNSIGSTCSRRKRRKRGNQIINIIKYLVIFRTILEGKETKIKVKIKIKIEKGKTDKKDKEGKPLKKKEL